MRQINLPIIINRETDYFLTAKGKPVWSVRTSAEYDALMELTKVFGSSIYETTGFIGKSNVGKEEVVGLGKDVESNAKLYAHLTERNYRLANSLDDLIREELPAVVITTAQWITTELLNLLYSGSKKSFPGIIYAATSETLRLQVLLRSAAAVLCGPVNVPRIDIFPTLKISHISTNDHQIIGSYASPHKIKSALTRGASVLSVMTHSDGLDAYFGDNLTLCPVFQSLTKIYDKFSPRCVKTRLCHRHKIPVEDAMELGNLISPDMFSARILLLNVCFGLLTFDGRINKIWGLTDKLISNPKIGAIVTTWQVVLTKPSDTNTLANSLIKGKPIGKSLFQFNTSSKASRLGHRMCLIGDPRVRSSTSITNKYKIIPLLADKVPFVQSTTKKNIKEINFIRACLVNASDRLNGELLKLCQNALENVQKYELRVWMNKVVEGLPNAQGPVMRETLLQYLFESGAIISNEWLSFKKYTQKLKPTICFFCNTLSTTIISSLSVFGVSRRRVTLCPLCGLIEDVPVNFNLNLSIINNSDIQINGEFPKSNWTVGVMVRSDLPSENIKLKWTSNSEELPPRKISIPGNLPVGPIELIFILIWEANLAVIIRRIYGSK